jgi:DNA-directed RNA polymerase subunit RPC12/RpoP
LKYICTSNHATETVHPNTCFETAIQRHDLALAQAYIPTDVDNPSLAAVLIPSDKSKAQCDASPAKIDSTNSTTPCPIFCHGCGLVSDGDDLLDQVQCERCKFWLHMKCLPDDVDWSNPEIEFICARCKPKPRSDSELYVFPSCLYSFF